VGCLDDNDVALLTAGAPSPQERAALHAHLDGCAACREVMAEALRWSYQGQRLLNPGDKLGRYFVLELVGAGAMGVVYAAFDPELNRKVALKVMRAEADTGGPRLVREAQALARLSHPHVVVVHDVGVEAGQMFLAMEFASGGTLRQWLATAPTWRTVVRTVADAGEGLAAAHEAGLVHRDFKPDNVMLDTKGRARVTDFGLARGDEGPPIGDVLSTSRQGTPAYMAPEVMAGQSATAASDQFSFSVTLYEALAGRRPFLGQSLAALDAAMRQPPEPIASVPGWLNRVLARGLSADPSARFDSMPALLRALRRGLEPGSRRSGVLAFGLLGGVALAVVARTHTPGPCSGGPAAWNDAWSDARAAIVARAFATSLVPDAARLGAQLNQALQARQVRWLTTFTGVCEATHARAEQSEGLLDARMQCLHARREEVAALAASLRTAPPEAQGRALDVVADLPEPETCASVGAAHVSVLRSPEERARVTELLARALVQALTLQRGVIDATLGELTPLVERPGFEPERAQAKLILGRWLIASGQVVAAEPTLHEAAALADEAADDATAADAWLSLAGVTGLHRAHPVEARWWLRYAEAAIHRLGGDAAREGLLLRQLGMLAWRFDHDLDASQALAHRALAQLEPMGARAEHSRMLVRELLAGIAFDVGRFDEALALHRDVLATCERLRGFNNVSVAEVNVGEDLVMLGRFDEALPHLERALTLDRPPYRVAGNDSYDLTRLALMHRLQHHPEQALALDRAALEAMTVSGLQGTYWESLPLTGMGLDLLALGRGREAVEPLTRAEQERLDAPARDLAETRAALGQARYDAGDHRAGRALMQQALETTRAHATRYGDVYLTRQHELEAWLATHLDETR
jgi:tetratricopeptide (TPR) repeat protein